MNTAIAAPCDYAATQPPSRQAARHPKWTLAATILASSLAFLDGSVVNVALLAIGRDLGASAADLQWRAIFYVNIPVAAAAALAGCLTLDARTPG